MARGVYRDQQFRNAPENQPRYALSRVERASIVEWLSGELNKASFIRRNSKEHSSFRRLTKYEYDYALQDLLGLPYSLANKLPRKHHRRRFQEQFRTAADVSDAV